MRFFLGWLMGQHFTPVIHHGRFQAHATHMATGNLLLPDHVLNSLPGHLHDEDITYKFQV